MAFLPTLLGGGRRRMESKVSTPVALAQYYASIAGLNHTSTRDWPIERAVAEGYDRVMWVFKSVNTIADDTSGLTFRLREGDDEDAPVVEDHPLYNVLNKQANPLERGPVFRKRLSAQILLSKKGAFVEVTKSNRGTVIRLDLLPPDRVEIIPDSNGGVKHYQLNRRNGGVKNLDPENVRWFRDPHPTDPYMGVTPLESAGPSIELDHFARIYNVAFLRNDGRPGGILAVRDTAGSGKDIDPAQMDRIESRFGKGPVEAGKLSVVAGALDYVDLAAKPRDMQYGMLANNARMEILGAFGIGETVLGNASGRTFDNADNELYVYWTRTLPPHHKIILTGFDEDSDDGLSGFFDTSNVEILERAAKDRRKEAREEVGAGLRSLYSYAQLAKITDIESTPHTRALYIPTGKTPLPSTSADAEALGMGAPVDPAASAGGSPGAPALPPVDQAAPGDGLPPADGEAAPPAIGAAPTPAALPAPAAPGDGGTGDAPRTARAALDAVAGKGVALRAIEGGRPKVTAAYRLSRKRAADPALYTESTPDEDTIAAFERQITAALAALTERWTERAAVRLGSPKQRKGTRHWTPEYANDVRVGTKALDTARAVDEDTWRAEAERETTPLITAAAIAAAVALMTDVGVTPPPGWTLARMAAEAVAQTVSEVAGFIGRAAANQALRLSAEINRLDQTDADLAAIRAAVRDRAARLVPWCESLATHVATATFNGARDDGAVEANRDENVQIERAWTSRRDDKVRLSHHDADGQIRNLDEPFIVGSSLLMRPGDPAAPIHETANCRCRLKHRSKRTGRWVSDPANGTGLIAGKAAVVLDGDGDGFIYDGTPQQRPAPPRLRAVTGGAAAPARPVPDTTATTVTAAPAVQQVAKATADDLIAKGAARVAKYRAKARDWAGKRIPDDLTGFAAWNERMAQVQATSGNRQTLGMTEDEVRDAVAAMFTNAWTTPSGRQVSTDVEVQVSPSFARVAGSIFDGDGNPIGKFNRTIRVGSFTAERERTVYHDDLEVQPDWQGDGIGSELNAHAMAFYREHGFDRIKVTAGGDTNQRVPDAMTGGYVWATQGFDFDRDSANRTFALSPYGLVAARADDSDTFSWAEERLVSQYGIPEEWLETNRAALMALLRQIDRDDPPTPYELATLGQDMPFTDGHTGETTWFGKALMLRTTWDGIFDLSWLDAYPETKAFATADARGPLLASQMLAALGDDSAAGDVLRSVPDDDVEAETKAARLPRDGDRDGFIYDGTPMQMPAPLRAALGQEAAIARGATKMQPHFREAAQWQGHRFPDLADATFRDAQQVLTATFGTTFTTTSGRVVRVDLNADTIEPGAYQVYGRFLDADTGEELGIFERGIKTLDGQITVLHEGLTIEPWAQGDGIATEFNAHAFAWYRHMGVDQVIVSASGSIEQKPRPTAGKPQDRGSADAPLPLSEVLARPRSSTNGGYTWGQAGFDWRRQSFLMTIPGTMLMAVEDEPSTLTALRNWTGLTTAEQFDLMEWFDMPFLTSGWWDDAANRAMVLKFIEDTDYNDPPTPYEINRLGEARPFEDIETGEVTWFGKAIMSRSTWLGYFDPKWLDSYIETKARGPRKARRRILAAAFLAYLGDDEVGVEEKSVRALGSAVAHGLSQIEALAWRDEPRDGDNDGFVYDGTPRQRPALNKPGTLQRGRPYAETLERQRTRRAEAERAAFARAAARTSVYEATRDKPVKPSQQYLVGPDDAAPWGDDTVGDTEGMTLILSRLIAAPMHNAGSDLRLLDRLVEVARGYDEARRDGDTAAADGIRERLLALIARLRDLTLPNGEPVITDEDLGTTFPQIMATLTRRSAKSVYTGRMVKTIHRNEPRDADGDGFVDDGKPTMRPVSRRLNARWRRHPDGWMSADGGWFLYRGAPMAGGGTNAWFGMMRAPDDRIGTENGRYWDTRDGQPLTEVDGNLYVHEFDAASLAEAKLTIEQREKPDAEQAENVEQAGYDAAAERFGKVSVEQMRVARDRAREAVEGPDLPESQREALRGAIRWLNDTLDAIDVPDPDPTPDPDPDREAVYEAERTLLRPMDRMRAVTDDNAARIASEHVGEDVTILRTDQTLGGLEKGRHVFGVWLPDGPTIVVPPDYHLSPFEVYHETAHLLTSRGDDVNGHGAEFQREYMRILPDALADRLRPGMPALNARDANDERFRPTRQGRVDGDGTEDDPIDVRGDLELAARLIADGKHVRLNRVDQIGTLVTKLAALVRMAEARGDDAPTYDLCKVSVPGTNLFCRQSMGIPRIGMPQLSGKPKPGSPADDLPRNERGNVNIKPLFRDWLIGRGVAVEQADVDTAWLKASQHELDGGAVGRIYARLLEGGATGSGSWATRDGYIIDGHHQWAAQVGVDSANGTLGDHKMDVMLVDLDIGEALTLAHAFSAEQGITAAGIGAEDTARATLDVREAVEQPAAFVPDEQPKRNRLFGRRIGVPERRPLPGGGYTLVETLGGRTEGATVERVIFRVLRRDGIWGVYPPQEQAPADFLGTKREADRYAAEHADDNRYGAKGLNDERDGDGDGFIHDGTPRQRPAPVRVPEIPHVTAPAASRVEPPTAPRPARGMDNIALVHEYANFIVPDGDARTRTAAMARYREVEAEVRKRQLVPASLDAEPANLPNTHRVETVTLTEGDHVLLDGRAHKVHEATDDGENVSLSVEMLATGERKFLVRKRSSLINKIVLSIGAFLALAFAALAGGIALGDALNGSESNSDTISAPLVPGGSDGKIDNPPLNEMPDKPAPRTAAGYADMFQSLDTDAWGAADASISEELPDGRRVWLYGDTFSGENGFVHSTAITQDGGNLHVSHDGQQLFPNDGTLEQDGKTYKRIYWVEDVSLLDNGNLRVSTMPIAMGDENVWDFFRIRPDESRIAEVSVDEAGDAFFEGWMGWTERPALTTDGEDYAVDPDNPHHFTYQHVIHDIQLASGKWLKTNAQNWDDDLSNHINPHTGELFYEDYRPQFTGVDTRDVPYEPNELNLPINEWHDFEDAVAAQMEAEANGE